jgi:hypothetical protein
MGSGGGGAYGTPRNGWRAKPRSTRLSLARCRGGDVGTGDAESWSTRRVVGCVTSTAKIEAIRGRCGGFPRRRGCAGDLGAGQGGKAFPPHAALRDVGFEDGSDTMRHVTGGAATLPVLICAVQDPDGLQGPSRTGGPNGCRIGKVVDARRLGKRVEDFGRVDGLLLGLGFSLFFENQPHCDTFPLTVKLVSTGRHHIASHRCETAMVPQRAR